MPDLHGLSGKTMPAGEAALRRKMRALSNALKERKGRGLTDLVDGAQAYRAAGILIDQILTGEYDPLLKDTDD